MKGFPGVLSRIAILLLTCGVVFGIGSWILLRGQQTQNARQEITLAGLQRETNEAKAAKRALPRFREEVKRLEQEANKLSAAAAGGGISELLPRLRRISTASGVTLQRLVSSSGGDDPEIAARITIRGSTRQVLAFFAALRQVPLIADDLGLLAVEGKADVWQADLVVSSPLEAPGDEP